MYESTTRWMCVGVSRMHMFSHSLSKSTVHDAFHRRHSVQHTGLREVAEVEDREEVDNHGRRPILCPLARTSDNVTCGICIRCRLNINPCARATVHFHQDNRVPPHRLVARVPVVAFVVARFAHHSVPQYH